MATIEGSFDPSAVAGARAALTLARGKTLVYNESNIGLILTFPNGDMYFVPAWTRRVVCLSQPASYVDWKQYPVYTFAPGSNPSSVVLFESLQPSDPQNPLELVSLGGRVTNAGSTVTVQSTNTMYSNYYQNPGSPFVIANDGAYHSPLSLIVNGLTASRPAILLARWGLINFAAPDILGYDVTDNGTSIFSVSGLQCVVQNPTTDGNEHTNFVPFTVASGNHTFVLNFKCISASGAASIPVATMALIVF